MNQNKFQTTHETCMCETHPKKQWRPEVNYEIKNHTNPNLIQNNTYKQHSNGFEN